MAVLERWKNLGIKLETPDDGILLIVNGDFNDADYLEQTWRFEYDDIGLVMWLLERYEKFLHHWYEILEGKEKKLFAKYIPRAYDTCWGISAHTIRKAHAYIFENGVCSEIKTGGSYEVPTTDSLYERYIEDDDY